ncbi:MAG TPA: hypothetical protein VGD67_25465 [Pseudonocardiaceae bacterium]
MSSLTFRRQIRVSRGTGELRWLDLVVDGRSLHAAIGSPDLVSVLVVGAAAGGVAVLDLSDFVDELLLRRPPSLPGGRCRLFVCPECADLGCGAVGLTVEADGDHVVWCDLGYQNDYEPQIWFEEYAHVGPFRFRRTDYQAALTGAIG